MLTKIQPQDINSNLARAIADYENRIKEKQLKEKLINNNNHEYKKISTRQFSI